MTHNAGSFALELPYDSGTRTPGKVHEFVCWAPRCNGCVSAASLSLAMVNLRCQEARMRTHRQTTLTPPDGHAPSLVNETNHYFRHFLIIYMPEYTNSIRIPF